MPDPETRNTTSNEAPSEILGRRKLLGRSAALAGTAAAGAIALGVAGSRPAAAENGDPFIMDFRGNRVHTPTGQTYAKGEDPSAATLILENADGPALQLLPVPEGSQDVKKVPFGSEPGCFFATLERPVFSAGAEGQSFPVGLATLDDADVIEQPNVSVAQRILDTTKNFPGMVADASSLDASGRLRAGRSIDLQVSPTLYPDVDLDIPAMSAVFLNVHSSGSTANGILSVCLPDQSKQATLHFTKGVTVANSP